jgi:hypothetical protein
MYELGLPLVLDQGKYTTIIEGKNNKKVPVGSILADFCNLEPLTMKEVLLRYPRRKDSCSVANAGDALMWLRKELKSRYGAITGTIIVTEIANSFSDYFESPEKTLKGYQKLQIASDIKDSVFKETDYSDIGNVDIGNLLLSFLYPFLTYYLRIEWIFKSLMEHTQDEYIMKVFVELAVLQKIDYKIAIREGQLTPIYTLRNAFSMLAFEMCNIMNQETVIKKCANCGNWFVPFNRSDEIYCDNPAPQDKSKTCKKYGAEKQYQENLKNSVSMGLYRKIYMSKQMLAKRNPDISEYSDSFEKFKVQSKQWKSDIKAKIKTEEEYIEWLKLVKERKVL